jgi:hypothetical protein
VIPDVDTDVTADGISPFRTIGLPSDNLVKYLAHFDASPSDLLGQVDDTFGTVLHVVVGGSVPAGYATTTSDLDLYVLVDGADLTTVPVVSHELGCLIDIFHVSAQEFEAGCRAVADPAWFDGEVENPRERWSQRTLNFATRIAAGAVVMTSEAWTDQQSRLRGAWLTERSAERWRLVARRNLVAANWLGATRPRVALQAATEAGLCALKAVTTEAGFLLANRKWVPLELRAMERADLVAMCRRWLSSAASEMPHDVVADEVAREVADLLDAPPRPVAIELAYLPAVELRKVGKKTLVWRWDMHGVEVDEMSLPDPDSTRAVWRGLPEDDPPPWVRGLFEHGLLWMGACHDAL